MDERKYLMNDLPNLHHILMSIKNEDGIYIPVISYELGNDHLNRVFYITKHIETGKFFIFNTLDDYPEISSLKEFFYN